MSVSMPETASETAPETMPVTAPGSEPAFPNTSRPRAEPDDSQQTIKDVTRFRALVMIIVALGLVVLRPAAMQPLPVAVLGLAFVSYLLILHFVVLPRHSSTYTILAMILLDIGFITLALYFTGGVESLLFTLFPISIMYSAVSLGYVGSFVAATAVTLCYGLLLVTTGTPASISGFLPLQMPFFYLLAGLSGYVVQMESLQRQQSRTLREMLQLERGAKEILKVTRDLNSSLNREEILPRVALVACQVTGLSRCLFALMDEERGSITAEASNLPAAAPGLDGIRELVASLRDGSVSQLAMQTGKPVVVERPKGDARVPAPLSSGQLPGGDVPGRWGEDALFRRRRDQGRPGLRRTGIHRHHQRTPLQRGAGADSESVGRDAVPRSEECGAPADGQAARSESWRPGTQRAATAGAGARPGCESLVDRV
jgi:hypothetical protein